MMPPPERVAAELARFEAYYLPPRRSLASSIRSSSDDWRPRFCSATTTDVMIFR